LSVVSATRPERTTTLDAIVTAYNDVTERLKHSHDRLADEVRRLRDQLDEKNRELARRERLAALGEMAAGVAHEIRNPLSGINLYASVLCRDLVDRPKCCQLAERIVSGVRTLDSIVGDILAFASQGPADCCPVAVEQVVRAVLESAEARRQASNVTVHVAPNVAGAEVVGDFNQLQRAVLNITLNAIDAAGRDGNVWISAAEVDAAAQTSIDIADDGLGIDPSMRERVFNPFFTTKDSGTGLGLAIVHGIAEAHGGRVCVEARPGGGAWFRLVLPSAGSE